MTKIPKSATPSFGSLCTYAPPWMCWLARILGDRFVGMDTGARYNTITTAYKFCGKLYFWSVRREKVKIQGAEITMMFFDEVSE